MPSKFDHKIKTILQILHSRGYTVKGINQGIRLKMNGNVDVDIYTLKFDANKLRARLKLHIDDAGERIQIAGRLGGKLREALGNTLDMEEFKFSRCISGDYYYYARLFMLDLKIKRIMKAMRARGYCIKGIRQGIRLKMNGNVDIDIYTLQFDANKLRARLKLHIDDAGERARVIRDVSEKLREDMGSTLDMEEFKFSRCVSGNYYYYARLFMLDVQDVGSSEEKPEVLAVRKRGLSREAENTSKREDLQTVVEAFESVDSKMLRRSLDGLGIPRTSILRVAISRIFRAATDSEELKAAVQEEAMRISDPKDRSDLDAIVSVNDVAFLDAIIRMLHQSVSEGPGGMGGIINDH